MASALFDVVNGLQLTDNRGFFTANGNVVVNALTTSGGLYWTGNGKSISGIAITASATPPTSPPPSIGDQWYNTSNDVVYQYQFDGTSTYWVDISSTVITANANTSPIDTVITDSIKANVGAYQTYTNLSLNSLVTQANSNTAAYLTTYTGNIAASRLSLSSYTNVVITTGAETNRSVLSLVGNVYGRGGVGYFDALQLSSTYSEVTNPHKYVRLGPTGTFEIINSAYTSSLLALTDSGALNVVGPIQIGGKQAINGPAFAAYAQNILQTVPTDVQTKVLFQLEEFDTANCYSNSRFTPNVEGYYQLNAEVRFDGTSGTGEMMIILYKNGGEYKRGTNQSGTQIAANFWAMQVSSIAYANGTTDYFEIYVQHGAGADRTVTAVNNPAITWFNGCMLRGA